MTQPPYGSFPEPPQPPPHIQAAQQLPYQPAYPSAPPHGGYHTPVPPQAPYHSVPPQPVAPYPGAQHPMAPAQYKDATAAWLLWFFTGAFGGHHFYLGQTQRGVIYAVTFAASFLLSLAFIGLLGFIALFILWVVDATQLSERVRQCNAQAYAVNRSMGFA